MVQKKNKNIPAGTRRAVEISRKTPTVIVLKKHLAEKAEPEEDLEVKEGASFLQVKKYEPETGPKEVGIEADVIFPDIKEEIKDFSEKPVKEEKSKDQIIYLEETRIRKPGLTGRKVLVLAGFALVIVIFTLLSTVFARLNITYKPKVENLALQDIVIAFDASVSQILPGPKVIPAEKLEFTKEVSREFATTGKKNVEEKASGKVRIYNAYSSSPQKLVSSTRFLTETGILYRLKESVTVPGAKIEEGKIVPQYVETQVTADQPGEKANSSGEIKLKIPGLEGTPKYDSFYALAANGFSGGFKGLASVVTKDDLARAQQEVTKAAYDQIKNDITRQLPQEFKTLDSLEEIQIAKVTSPKENSVEEKFSVQVQAKAQVIIFREKDAVALISSILLTNEKNKKYVDNTANFSYQIQKADFDKGKAVAAVKGDLKAVAVVPEKELTEIVRGKKYGSINNFLAAREDLAGFGLSFFPPWISTAPKSGGQIKIKEE